MQFPIQIDILDFIFKGLLIGIISSAPMGPVGILCIQRTLNKGRWYGFVTGIGAAISDTIYALIVGLGVLLLLFGIYCFKSNPMKKMHQSSNTKGSIFHNGLTAFLVTISNPLIIFLFMATFAQFALVQPDRPFEMIVGFACIPAGALLWWYGLTWLVDKIRGKFDVNGVLIINKVIGSVVILFSIIVLLGTIFNLYHLPTVDGLMK